MCVCVCVSVRACVFVSLSLCFFMMSTYILIRPVSVRVCVLKYALHLLACCSSCCMVLVHTCAHELQCVLKSVKENHIMLRCES